MSKPIINGIDVSECPLYDKNTGCYLQSEIEKRQKLLEEIKKWATNHNPCDIEAGINCTKEDCFKCLNYDIKKITEIINEVLNDN